MKKLLLILLFGMPIWAGQSLKLAPSRTASATLTPTNQGDFRVEMRLHGITTGTAYLGIVGSGAEGAEFPAVTLNSNGLGLTAPNTPDTMSDPGTYPSILFSGRTDIVIRLQRNAIAMTYTLEMWNADGTSYSVSSLPIASLGTWDMGSIQFPALYATSAQVSVGYFRLYSTLVALNSTPPNGVAGGDLLDYEFEGDLTDSAGSNDLTAGGGTATYEATPAVAPAANAGVDTTARRGTAITLAGSGVGDSALTYAWAKTSGPGTVTFGDATSATSTASFDTAGEYVLTLTITDADAATDTDTVTVGVVNASAAYVVSTGDADVDTILGPLLMYTKSPWTWFDDRSKAVADHFGSLMDTATAWQDTWNTALAGTVSVTNGSATVTGTSTTFQADFCSGGTTPDDTYQFVAWYSQGGVIGRSLNQVAACISDTEITLSTAYTASPGTQSSLSYSRWDSYGVWIGNSSNINFYDNVMAYYALYYRTGLTVYRDYARTLADSWYTMPFYIDKGLPTIKDGSIWMLPRNIALTGIILRALDGKPEYWDGLEPILDVMATRIQYTTEIYDIREAGYDLAFVALGALFSTDATKRAAYTAALEVALEDRWAPQQQANGQWRMISYGYDSWDAYPGTVTVTNGSATVTGTDTTWSSGTTNGKWFWVLDDTAYYTATYNSPTQVTLDRPYEGTNGSGKQWSFHSDLVGRGTQPFQMGIVANAWYWAYLALNAASSADTATARQFVLDAVDWITTYGYSSTAKGLYYARDFLNCEPISEANANCGASVIEDARYLNAEVMRAYSTAYALTGIAGYKTQADILFGAQWGGPSTVGPGADGTYVSEYLDSGYTFTANKAKNFGFGFGFGGGPTWPAARLGNPTTRTIHGRVTFRGRTGP
jgi:hypothetical protein